MPKLKNTVKKRKKSSDHDDTDQDSEDGGGSAGSGSRQDSAKWKRRAVLLCRTCRRSLLVDERWIMFSGIGKRQTKFRPGEADKAYADGFHFCTSCAPPPTPKKAHSFYHSRKLERSPIKRAAKRAATAAKRAATAGKRASSRKPRTKAKYKKYNAKRQAKSQTCTTSQDKTNADIEDRCAHLFASTADTTPPPEELAERMQSARSAVDSLNDLTCCAVCDELKPLHTMSVEDVNKRPPSKYHNAGLPEHTLNDILE